MIDDQSLKELGKRPLCLSWGGLVILYSPPAMVLELPEVWVKVQHHPITDDNRYVLGWFKTLCPTNERGDVLPAEKAQAMRVTWDDDIDDAGDPLAPYLVIRLESANHTAFIDPKYYQFLRDYLDELELRLWAPTPEQTHPPVGVYRKGRVVGVIAQVLKSTTARELGYTA